MVNRQKMLFGVGVLVVLTLATVAVIAIRRHSSVKLNPFRVGPGISEPLEPGFPVDRRAEIEFHIVLEKPAFVYVFDEHDGRFQKVSAHPVGSPAWDPGEYASDPPDNQSGFRFSSGGSHRFVAVASPKALTVEKEYPSMRGFLDAECHDCSTSEFVAEVAAATTGYGNP